MRDRAFVRENRRLLVKLKAAIDSDPNAWPSMTTPGDYMVDCMNCGSRLNPSAMSFHQKRCTAAKTGQ